VESAKGLELSLQLVGSKMITPYPFSIMYGVGPKPLKNEVGLGVLVGRKGKKLLGEFDCYAWRKVERSTIFRAETLIS